MILLDTDHLTVLRYVASDRRLRLVGRLAQAGDEVVGTTVVNVEEQMRGWLAAAARERQVRRQVSAYRELAALFAFFAPLHIAHFDDAAVDRFEAMRGIRIGTTDKKVAAVCVANDALLLTANRQDFEQIPGLRFENWLD
jgi:tRNA(fMet)-specific endonuclease VapC